MKKKHIITTTILIFAVLLVIVYDRDLLTVLTKGSVDQVVDLINSWGIIAPLLSILLMILQAIAAPIPAFLITAANGIAFGIYGGIIVSWIGAMLGAVVSYLLAKWLGDKFVTKVVKKEVKWMEKVKNLSGKYGFSSVLVARLIPVISFDIVSYAAGLSGMSLRSFLTATGIGMIPGTVLYTVLGHDLIHFEEYQGRFITVSLLLACIIVIVTIVKRKYKIKNKDEIKKE